MDRGEVTRVLGLVLAAACAACTPGAPQQRAASTAPPSVLSSPLEPSSAASPAATGAYERLVLASRPAGYWPLDLQAELLRGDAVPSLVSGEQDGVVAEGAVRPVPGPLLRGEPTTAAAFDGVGLVSLPTVTGLRSTDAFSVELWVAPGACNGSWGRIAGTEAYGDAGRDGLSFFHYPRQARAAVRCRLGIELWSGNRFVVGCPGVAAAEPGRWRHLALTYSPQASATCFVDGDPVRGIGPRPAPYMFGQPASLGVGGTGAGFGGSLATGAVAHVALHARVLPAQELRTRAAAQAPQ